MKTKIFSFTIIVIAVIAFAISFTHSSPTERMGRMRQTDGMYLFYQCDPVDDYTYLGTLKTTVSWSGKPSELFGQMKSKAKKKYPTADAIIIKNDDLDEYDAIQFK